MIVQNENSLVLYVTLSIMLDILFHTDTIQKIASKHRYIPVISLAIKPNLDIQIKIDISIKVAVIGAKKQSFNRDRLLDMSSLS